GYQAGSLVGSQSQRRAPETPDWRPPQSYHLVAETAAHGAVPAVSFEMKVHDIDGQPSLRAGSGRVQADSGHFSALAGHGQTERRSTVKRAINRLVLCLLSLMVGFSSTPCYMFEV